MCQLTDSRGDFWRRVYARVADPVSVMGITLARSREDQVLREKQAKRRADSALNALRVLEADDKTVMEALESVSYVVTFRHPERLAALAAAYRSDDHAELGRIVASAMRDDMQEKAEDSASDECAKVEDAEEAAAERSAA